VMAAVHATLAHVSELQGDRGALVEERQEPAINGRRSQNSERALTYMNASSGQNLSDALMANENVTHTRVEPRSALDGVTDTARLRRTNVTCIWGVSDPLRQSAESRPEGGRGGRSRPRCLVRCC